MLTFLKTRWRAMTGRRRLVMLALATVIAAAVATVALLRNAGVDVILYKAF